MKSLVMITFLSILTSCAPRRPGKPGTIGPSGNDGTNGQDGYSLVVDVRTIVTTNGVTCKQTDIFQDTDRNNFYSSNDTYQNGFIVCNGTIGPKGDTGNSGQDGNDGLDGSNGTNGVDGEKGDKGNKGDNGEDGLDANTTYEIASIFDPCGPQHPNGYDEVILVLGNGTYIASFSDNANGLNTRFTVLPTGRSYRTTDNTGCTFSI